MEALAGLQLKNDVKRRRRAMWVVVILVLLFWNVKSITDGVALEGLIWVIERGREVWVGLGGRVRKKQWHCH